MQWLIMDLLDMSEVPYGAGYAGITNPISAFLSTLESSCGINKLAAPARGLRCSSMHEVYPNYYTNSSTEHF